VIPSLFCTHGRVRLAVLEACFVRVNGVVLGLGNLLFLRRNLPELPSEYVRVGVIDWIVPG